MKMVCLCMCLRVHVCMFLRVCPFVYVRTCCCSCLFDNRRKTYNWTKINKICKYFVKHVIYINKQNIFEKYF